MFLVLLSFLVDTIISPIITDIQMCTYVYDFTQLSKNEHQGSVTGRLMDIHLEVLKVHVHELITLPH